MHQPELLILDEPTVGVDALLRAKLWHYLLELVKTEDVTILITTHYIEEARQADIVGLMRDGRLLAEAAPSELLARYNKHSLEAVFLELCRNHTTLDDENRTRSALQLPHLTEPNETSGEERAQLLKPVNQEAEPVPPPRPKTEHMPKWVNIKSLVWKNFTRMRSGLIAVPVLTSCLAVAHRASLRLCFCSLPSRSPFSASPSVRFFFGACFGFASRVAQAPCHAASMWRSAIRTAGPSPRCSSWATTFSRSSATRPSRN